MLPLISLVLTLAIVGFIIWLVVTYIPMPDIFKTVIVVVVAIFLLLYCLGLLTGSGGHVTLPTLR